MLYGQDTRPQRSRNSASMSQKHHKKDRAEAIITNTKLQRVLAVLVLVSILLTSIFLSKSSIGSSFQHYRQKNTVSDTRSDSLDDDDDDDDMMIHVYQVELEEVYRQVASGIRNTAAFIRFNLRPVIVGVKSINNRDLHKFLDETEDRMRVVQHELSKLSRISNLGEWREREAVTLSKEVQRKIYALQNPPNCAKVKKLVCDLKRGHGAGSLIHHLQSCIMTAYGNGMTFVLESKGWRYSPKGWEVLFQPVSHTCRNVTLGVVDKWPGSKKSDAIRFPTFDNPSPVPRYSPMAIPADIAGRLQRFQENPADWWAGQFVGYLLRLQPHMQETIDRIKRQLNFKSPIVGIHVRRTDKLRREAKFYKLEEYMEHVENYFLGLQLSSPGVPVRRRVYLASEESSLISEAKNKYPGYEFLWRNNTGDNRRGVKSLTNLMVDIYFLSRSDYLVCTFTSNVCRLTYEWMQSLHADARSRVVSLDSTYFMYNQPTPRRFKVRFPHYTDRSAKNNMTIEADVGQKFNGINSYFGSGYIKVQDPRKPKKIKHLPDYKLIEVVDVVNVTLPNFVTKEMDD